MKTLFKKIIITILKLEAKLILARFRPKIIAVTGTVGKTSVKEAVALVLGSEFNVRKSEKSYNSEIGVPLTIIGAQTGWGSFKQWLAVIFKGLKVFCLPAIILSFWFWKWGGQAERYGKNGFLGQALCGRYYRRRNNTRPCPVFQRAGRIDKRKRKLVECLNDNNWAVLNIDDKAVSSFRKNTKAQTITYGFSESADLVASNYKMDGEGIVFKVSYKGNIVPVKLAQFFGRHNVYTALSAIGAGLACGVNLVKSVEAVSKMKPPLGRMNLLEGVNGSLIFDDSYNSSPIAAEAAIEVLSEYPAKEDSPFWAI